MQDRAQYITERMGLRDVTIAVVTLCIWREARGESHEGRVAVAHAIRNRAEDPLRRWPASPARVCLQPKQFSCFNEGDPNDEQYPEATDPAFEDCFRIACEVFDKPEPGIPDPTKGSNHYHEMSIWPKWADPQKWVVTIGRHIFYRL